MQIRHSFWRSIVIFEMGSLHTGLYVDQIVHRTHIVNKITVYPKIGKALCVLKVRD